MLDFMCMGFTKLRESSVNQTRDLSHRKLKISLDHLVTLTDDEMCLKSYRIMSYKLFKQLTI